ncbi:MAG: glycosyltransferase family 4 protein [Candidatus Thorarchaeota archaeon]|nr:glycosyltransferase family 4 protein [Candidatus Thorarchaeota archaeon]
MRERRRALRVLMVTPRFWPAIGGVEKHVERVCEELGRMNVESQVVTLSHSQGLRQGESRRGTVVHRLPFGSRLLAPFSLIMSGGLRAAVKSCDLVHFHDVVPLLLLYLPVRVLCPNRPFYATFHGLEADPVPFHWRFLRRLARCLVRRCICVGGFIATEYGIRCDTLTHGAVATSEAETEERSGAVFVGRIEPDTRLADYVHAIHTLNRRGREMRLTVCGSGSIADHVRQLAESLRVDAQFMGHVERPEAAVARSQVMFASGYMSCLEAMALGVPVVAIAATPLKMAYFKSLRAAGAPISIQTSLEGVVREVERILDNAALQREVSQRGRRFTSTSTWTELARTYLWLWTSPKNRPRRRSLPPVK